MLHSTAATPDLHRWHHSTVYEEGDSNYGAVTSVWDRVFGTYRDGESEVVGQDDRKRLSIKEQWLFPLRPWLEKRKAVEG